MLLQLPDGRVIKVGGERFEAPEALFQPHLINVDGVGVAELLFNTIQAGDINIRSDLYKHIVLSGGSTMLPGLPSRMEREIKQLYLERVLKGDTEKLAVSSACCYMMSSSSAFSQFVGWRIKFSISTFSGLVLLLCTPFSFMFFLYHHSTSVLVFISMSTHFHVLITISSSVFLSTWPNNPSLASLIVSLMFAAPALALISSVVIFSILFIPIIHINILISVLSSKPCSASQCPGLTSIHDTYHVFNVAPHAHCFSIFFVALGPTFMSFHSYFRRSIY